MIFIYSTFPNKKEVKEIGERLVKNKLVACVNIFPIESIYFWRNKIIKDKEFAAIIKTKKENFEKVEKFILENHSYDTPCIIEIPLGRITKKYLSWLGKNLSA
ncbi:MAG: divalent-cation tolerance protein CutA [bacterium]|nr:divalent-cation tolerance protein CutA [bacterium]